MRVKHNVYKSLRDFYATFLQKFIIMWKVEFRKKLNTTVFGVCF